jgi:hypothetical protein
VFRTAGPEQAAWVDGLAPGTTLGRYDLIREVGRGGSAVVWEARDREIGRRVAVKVIRRAGTGTPERRVVAEADVAARLAHPGIVTILDVGRNDKGAWLVQEFLVGRTLAARLAGGPLPIAEALDVATKIAAALAYAHGHGVVHRDLSSSNVFLCEDGQVKILDLGMAQAFGRRKLEGGTADFMAPEQAAGLPEDERVDVYALGVILHQMLVGRSPFPPGTAADRRLPPTLETPGVPGLGELVGRMLAPDPGSRPRDASAVLGELDELRASLPRSGPTPGRVRVRRRWPRWAVAAAGVLLAAGLVAAGFASGRRWAAASTTRQPVTVGATSSSPACDWGNATWYDLDKAPDGIVLRNGEIGGQGVAEVAGRRAWRITSDWGIALLPAGRAALGDPFAVEVEFHVPPVTGWQRGANLTAFTDLVDATSGKARSGISLAVREEPGKPPWFELTTPDGNGGLRHRHVGTLPGSITGRWHTLRLEGSRSGRWVRGLFDGVPLVVTQGDHDLSGTKVLLGSGYGPMHPADTAFSNLRTFAGTPECQ